MALEGGPTSEITRYVLPLIASGQTSLHIVALAADVIAESARMNIWAQEAQNRKYDLGKSGTAHLERWLEIVDFFTKAEDQCIAAVNRFNEGGDHKKLAEALRRLADTFNQRPTLPPNQISN
jgi:hypothetical protein